jgi:hypothetical protein
MILPERTYVLGEESVGLLHAAGVRFSQISCAVVAPICE